MYRVCVLLWTKIYSLVFGGKLNLLMICHVTAGVGR